MRMIVMSALLLALAAPAQAQAQSYPVQGRWGQSASLEKGPIDCAGKRVIAFLGNQRTQQRRRAELSQSIGRAGGASQLSHRRRIHDRTDQCRTHVLYFATSRR